MEPFFSRAQWRIRYLDQLIGYALDRAEQEHDGFASSLGARHHLPTLAQSLDGFRTAWLRHIGRLRRVRVRTSLDGLH